MSCEGSRLRARELAVVGLSNGRLQLRMPLRALAIRVAARRGVAVLQIEPQRLGVVDLRTGRVLGSLATSTTLVDFAIDPDGGRLALRSQGGDLELLPLAQAMAQHASATRPDAAPGRRSLSAPPGP